MGHASIAQKLDSFYRQPTEKRFRSLQRLVMAEGDYDPRATAIVQLEARIDSANPRELLKEIDQLPWFWHLCPRLHFAQARLYEQRGHRRKMSDCVDRMQASLRGVLATGDGSSEAPYAVTFLTDPRDILQVIGEDVRYQQLQQRGDRCCDVITSHAGTDVWFDVTELLERIPMPLAAVHSRDL